MCGVNDQIQRRLLSETELDLKLWKWRWQRTFASCKVRDVQRSRSCRKTCAKVSVVMNDCTVFTGCLCICLPWEVGAWSLWLSANLPYMAYFATVLTPGGPEWGGLAFGFAFHTCTRELRTIMSFHMSRTPLELRLANHWKWKATVCVG